MHWRSWLIYFGAVAGASAAERISFAEIHSKALGRTMPVAIIAPAKPIANDSVPVLFILHGRGRHHQTMTDSPVMRSMLLEAPFYVVLPQGEDGWYIDSPVRSTDRYNAYIEEVIAWAGQNLPVAREPARRAIAGWSMGGYGAMRFAQTHPGEFGTIVTIVGLLDFPREATLPSGQNYAVPVARFGADPVVWRENNPINSVGALRGNSILIITADDAFDRTMNINFSTALAAAGIVHEFRRLPGGHTLDVVQSALPGLLEFVRRQTGAAALP